VSGSKAPGSAGVALEARAISAAYGRKPVLQDITFQAQAGTLVAVIGLNGAGKTTLLRVLAGIKRPTAGRAAVCGVDPHARGGQQVPLAIVLQGVTVDRQLTGREYLEFAGRASGIRKRRVLALLETVIDRLDLGSFVDQRGDRLSGGQARRIQLASSLMREPRVLLLDEPTSGLDPSARRRYWPLVRTLTADGITVVAVTHHIDEAGLADQLLIISDGRIVSRGRPHDLVGEAALSVVEVDCPTPALAGDLHRRLVRHGADRSDTTVTVTTSEPSAVLLEVEASAGHEAAAVTVRPATLDDLLVHLASIEAARAHD
jgi:ABC-type multidrug transport system ATPase subunit